MQCDIFFSICQASIEGIMPSEAHMLTHFLEQVRLADHLGFKTAWVAESHFSSQVQQQHLNPVIPKFRGEIGLNTDILQVAHHIFSQTEKIAVGSAIKNILCHGGPLTHAEAVKTFLWLKSASVFKDRELKLGMAGGRFDYMIRPFGLRPRNTFEEATWPIIKGKIVKEAVEIFLKGIRGDTFSSKDISPNTLTASDCRSFEQWDRLTTHYKNKLVTDEDRPYFQLQPFWEFEPLKIVPHEPTLDTLSLYLGSHDPNTQQHANKTLPCRIFNLSITSPDIIENTHKRMTRVFHTQHKQSWHRSFLPRTTLVFLDASPLVSESTRHERAKSRAKHVLGQYWKAMSGTIDAKKLTDEVDNTLYGSPTQVAKQIRTRYHKDDCLMLWFDFYCHDNDAVKNSMEIFAKHVMPFI